MTVLTVADLTSTEASGAGAFDVLMRAIKSHLEQEHRRGSIKGPEFSTVYLGSLQLAMQTAVTYLLAKDKNDLESQLLTKQIELAGVEVQKAQAELAILQANQDKIPAEIAHIEAQTDLLVVQVPQVQAQTALVNQNKDNAVTEGANLVKQGVVLTNTGAKVASENLQVQAQTTVLDKQALHLVQQTANAVVENANLVKQGTVLVAQECKLRAEYDLILGQVTKTTEETALLTQKVTTERAQTQAVGVDPDSVIGRQKSLYAAQTAGFTRDAEQKAAKLLVDTWNVRRTTDVATVAGQPAGGIDNGLGDANIARAVNKLLSGVGA